MKIVADKKTANRERVQQARSEGEETIKVELTVAFRNFSIEIMRPNR